MPHPILKVLARRVATPGLLQSNQLGVTVHALRQVNLLSVRNGALLDVITSLAPDADARSLAATFHALALSTQEQCEPSVAISPELHRSLVCLQDSLTELTHELTASDNILATEALCELFVFGSSLLRIRLLDELLERTLGLVYAVERPIDFLGILRVIKRLHQGLSLPLVFHKGKDTDAGSSTNSTARTAAEDEERRIIERRIQQWSEESMTQALSAIQVRLNTWGKQDMISLLDAFTVRSEKPLLGPLSEGSDGKVPPRQPTQRLMDSALPLLPSLLDEATRSLDEMLPSHSVAWMVRLANLQLYPNAMPLFNGLMCRLSDTQTQKKMSLSQLGSLLAALSRIFSEMSESTGDAAASNFTSSTRLSSSSALPTKKVDNDSLSPKDKVACLSLFVSLFAEVVFRIDQLGRDNPNAEQAVKAELLPLLLRLPEDFFVRFSLYCKGGTSHSGSNTSATKVLKDFCTTLEKACSLLLRHFASLVPRDQVDVARTALHWNVFYAASLNSSEGGTASGHSTSSGGVTNGDAKGVFSDNITPKRTGGDLVWMFPPLSREAAARKLKALCGIIKQNVSQYNALDIIKIINEAVASIHVSLIPGSAGSGQGAQLSLTAHKPDVFEDVYSMCAVLRDALKDSRLRNEMAALPTFCLVRYLSTLSKLKVRTKAGYTEVLNLLSGRDLTPFELICVLGVMGRHHLNNPYFLTACVRRLEELGDVLELTQKAHLLKYMGQTNGQRFVRAPVFSALDGGAFFKSESEVKRLTYLEAVFCFNGLMELRQYENRVLRWLLDGPLIVGLDRNKNSVASPRQVVQSAIDHVRSPTTLAEFLTSLCRLGGPSQHVPLSLVSAVMQALQRAVVSSRSLFIDLAVLLSYWPILSRYTALLAYDTTICDSPLVNIGLHTGSAPSGSVSSGKGDQIDKVAVAWQALLKTAASLVKARLLDIAHSSHLRVNTFLFHQLAIGCCLNSMPQADSVEEKTLVQYMDLKNMIELVQNPRRLVNGVIIGLYLIPRYPTEALRISEFVLRHVGALRVQDALSVWCLLEDAFRTNPHLRSIDASPVCSATASVEGLARVRDTLHGLREETKVYVMKEQNTSKLSPMETYLCQSLL